METRRNREREAHRLHARRLLVAIVTGMAIGGTIGTLRVLTIF
jgi:hypothetical protein